ncbi:hypothetical protein JCM33374_g2466 [Metschnikowia sp. JCM 33374]|nr:hypothetical protein JCM33374_g2466 [Metschnikowia sp. JCM 33374]
MESAIESIAGISISNQNATDHVFFVDSNLIAISNFTMEISTATPATQKKRWSDGDSQLGATWMEYQTPQQGTWWGDWQPASCVHPNTHGDLPVTVSLTRNVSHRGTWKPGFNLDFGKSSSLHSGHETVKLNTISEMAWYAIPAYGYGQAWSQQLMVWQDQQRRSCKMEHYGPGGVTCGEWSDFFRGDLPVKNGVNFAWFTDWKKLDFNSCGGGT